MPEQVKHAALDIGSNTIRLLVVSGANPFAEIASIQEITRLGEGAHKSGKLSPNAIERTIAATERMLAAVARHRPYKIAAVATHAVRNAGNRGEFAASFEKRTGIPLTVVPWEMEASLALKGMESVIGPDAGALLLFDIGGGSTEFIYRDSSGGIRSTGTDLGVVRLTESYISKAPVDKEEYQRLEKYLEGELRKVTDTLDISEDFTLVGTAGTVTSMAALHLGIEEYDPGKINNAVMKIEDVARLRERIGSMDIAERGMMKPLRNGREDLIIPGFALVLCIMRGFGKDKLTVCDAGLREGIVAALIEGKLEGATR